ncbi:MAG: hypothetical protein HQK83_18130 [Fibrobacteria bacterium]|nr:hypothetical protein [Fibrobacteria bacterium]
MSLILTSHPQLFFSFLSIITSLFLFTLLLFKFRSRGGLNFAFLSLSVVLWQTGKLVKNLTLAFPIDADIYFWSSLSFAGVTFIFSTFFRMACRISFRDRGFLLFTSFLAYLSSIIFVILEINGLLATGETATYYGYFRNPTPLYYLYMATYFFFMIAGFLVLNPWYYKKIPQLRLQMQWVFWGSLLGFSLGSLEFLSVQGIHLYPLADLSPIVFGGTLYWAIYRFNIIGGTETVKSFLLRLTYFFFLFILVAAIYYTSIWVVKVLHFPSDNILLISIFSLLLFFLTPLYLYFAKSLRKRFFPVRFSYRKLYTTLSHKLSRLDTSEKMFETVLQHMENEYGYDKGSAIIFDYKSNKFDPSRFKVVGEALSNKIQSDYFLYRNYREILSKKHILENLRLGTIPEHFKNRQLMALRQLNRLNADILLPVHAHNEMIGLLLFTEKTFRPESWKVVTNLLSSLTEMLGNYSHQLQLIKSQSEQEHLSKVGMMSATMAHEIKNPLEGIYGAAQILKESESYNEKFVDIILKDSIRLNEVVSRFLQFSRPFIIKPAKFDLIDFTERFVDAQNAIQQLHQVVLQTSLSSLEITTDRDGLAQIMLNLIQNARKFQQPDNDEPILVSIIKKDASVEISVRDNGPGIPQHDLDKLFTPFFTTSVKGTGLGLAISHKIAQELGGDLSYDYGSPGALFTISLKAPTLRIGTKSSNN